jgi:hypothetical protein
MRFEEGLEVSFQQNYHLVALGEHQQVLVLLGYLLEQENIQILLQTTLVFSIFVILQKKSAFNFDNDFIFTLNVRCLTLEVKIEFEFALIQKIL